MNSYQSWLERQQELLLKALELLQSYKFRASILDDKFIRVYLQETHIDFYIKEIKSQFVKTVWLSKRSEFNARGYYLVYIDKGDIWKITTGREADAKGEYQDSDYHKDIQFLVVPMELFRPAKRFLKKLMKRIEDAKQKRINEWF